MPPSKLKLNLKPVTSAHSAAEISFGDTEFKPLADFFNDAVHLFEANSLARTYVMTEGAKSRVYAYLTLVCGEIKIRGPHSLLPDGVIYPYNSYPAIKLARLLIDNELRGDDLGTFLVEFAMGVAKDKICPAVGCRFLIVDSKQSSVGFYKKTGFTMLDTKDNKKRHQPLMFVDLHTATKAVPKSG